ncbi:MAG: GYD domain-containing protein [Dehalococcoidia bacterium]
MPKYLIRASYTTEGIRGLLKEGGTGRRASLEKAMASIGGTLESMYFAFGEDDAVLIVDAPDNASVAAAVLAAGATGSVANLNTTVLLTPEEMDEATKKSVAYSPPGG